MTKRLAAAALAALTACAQPPTAARTEPQISVPSQSFTFPAVGTLAVPYTLANGGAAAVSVPACGERPAMTVDQLVDGEWRQYGALRCEATQPMTPIELAPGAAVDDHVQFGVAGTFRLRLALAGGGETRSGRFTLRAEALR